MRSRVDLLRSGLVAMAGLCFVLAVGAVDLAAGQSEATRPAPDDWLLQGDQDNGMLVYKQYCQKCHGKRGDGQGTMAEDLDPKPRDFTDVEVMSQLSDWDIYLGIKEGGSSVGLSEQMTAWEDALEEEEMQDVAVFLRQFSEQGGK